LLYLNRFYLIENIKIKFLIFIFLKSVNKYFNFLFLIKFLIFFIKINELFELKYIDIITQNIIQLNFVNITKIKFK